MLFNDLGKKIWLSSRLLKNGHLLRFPHPSSFRRTVKYASLLKISGAPANGISLCSTCIWPFLSNLIGAGQGYSAQRKAIGQENLAENSIARAWSYDGRLLSF
jgi:hypothetical protein